VQAVETGEAALQLLIPQTEDVTQPAFDLVVLDVMLPVKDGFTVVSEMRGAGQFVPTLMLTARGRPEDVLEGFAAGADDYLPKPFELSILIARIRSLLRRKQWLRSTAPAAGAPKAAKDSFAFGEKSVHFDLLEVHAGGKVYPLTLMEASILRFLIDHEGRAVSRKSMLQEVWGLRDLPQVGGGSVAGRNGIHAVTALPRRRKSRRSTNSCGFR